MCVKRTLLLLLFVNSVMAQPYITRQQAMDDLEVMKTTILELHYNPYLFIDEATFNQSLTNCKQNLPDSLSLQQFIVTCYQITSLLKDGHCQPSVVQPLLIDDLKKEIFFPFRLVVYEGKVYVPMNTEMESGLPMGAEIVSINDINMSKYTLKIKSYLGGNENFTGEMSNRLLNYFMYLDGLRPPFDIRFIDSTGTEGSQFRPKGVKFANALATYMPGIKTPRHFKILNHRVGYLQFMSMSGDYNTWGNYLDSCFNLMKQQGITHFAVDLRDNSGGNSILGDLLLSYITTRKYTLMGGKKWKISKLYKEYLRQSGDTAHAYLNQPVGTIWSVGSCEPHDNMFKSDILFNGRVYFLTGAFTFSSANMLADGAKQYKLAEIVGEPTGENTNDFGEAYSFTLPNSGIKIQTTTSYDIGANCNNKTFTPVIPDKLIKTGLHDLISGNDPVLRYVLSQAK